MKKIEKRKDKTIRVATINEQPSRTKQQFAAECDVNVIMKRYFQTNQITHLNRKNGVYANLIGVTDYKDSLDLVIHANETFQTLPAHVRSRFENEPGKLLEFLNDSKNRQEAITLGLIEPDPVPAPTPAQPNTPVT